MKRERVEELLRLDAARACLVDADTIRERISLVSDLHLRAILMARLQLVLENV